MSVHNGAMGLKSLNSLSSLIKNPFLAIGVLVVTILFFQLEEKGLLKSFWESFKESRRAKLTPSSCRSVRVKLDRRIPDSWETRCEGGNYNNLAVIIKLDTSPRFDDQKRLKTYLYRQTANALVHIAQQGPSDNLERTDVIRLQVLHPQLEINAVTEGHLTVKLATLKNKKLIAQHLKHSVQIKEKSRP